MLKYAGHRWALIIPSLIIGLISVYDGYLVLRTGEDIDFFEKNMFNKWLIDATGSWYFFFVKCVTTLIVLLCLWYLHKKYTVHYFWISMAVVGFQIGLLWYLETN